MKSSVHLADWHGTAVVVKCVKMERRSMMTHVTKSDSLLESLKSDVALHEEV